ncbi:MAG: class I SAM-dependent methyltransferase [Microcoleaceae cyanobacterium]
MNTQTGSKIVDIAIRPGYVAVAATKPRCQVIGLDLSDAILRKAEQLHPHLELIQEAAEFFPFENSEFDALLINIGIISKSN